MRYDLLLQVLLCLTAPDVDAAMLVSRFWHDAVHKNRSKLSKRAIREVTIISTGPTFSWQAVAAGETIG